MNDPTYPCCRCHRPRPLSAYTPSEQMRLVEGRAGTCKLCKSEGQCVKHQIRKERDPLLLDCYDKAQLKDAEDAAVLAMLPESVLAEREARIARYAQQVERDGMTGDGRRWA